MLRVPKGISMSESARMDTCTSLSESTRMDTCASRGTYREQVVATMAG